MNFKSLIRRLTLLVIGFGVLGLVGLSVRDYFFPKPLDQELRKAQEILHNVHEKNKKLDEANQVLTQKHVDFLKIIEEKEKEIATLRDQSLKTTNLVKEVTKKNQKLSLADSLKKTKEKFQEAKKAYKPDYRPVRQEVQTPVFQSEIPGKRQIYEEAVKKSAAPPRESPAPEKIQKTNSETKKRIDDKKTYRPDYEPTPLEALEEEKPSEIAAPRQEVKETAKEKREQPESPELDAPLEEEKKLVMEMSQEDEEYQMRIALLEEKLESLENETLEREIPQANQTPDSEALSPETETEEIEIIEAETTPFKGTPPKKIVKNEKNTGRITESRSVEEAQREAQELKKKLKQNKMTYFYNLGVAYTQATKYLEAAEMFEKALEINPEDPSSHYNLGILYDEYLEKPERAVQHYTEFITYSADAEKKRIVKDWIKLSNFKQRPEGQTRLESGRKVLQSILLNSSE